MLRRNGIEIDEALDLPPCPPQLEYLLAWYDELRAWCRQGMSGVHPIVWSDAHAWATRMEVAPRPSEWRLLMQIDTRFRAAAAKAKPAERPGRAPPPNRGR